MAAKQSLKYGVAAVAIAIAIIAAAIATNPSLITPTTVGTSQSQQGTSSSAPSQQASSPGTQGGNFLVLLTDPPNVPPGTTQLNLTYSAISLEVKEANGTMAWLPVKASGTVDLLALVNVTQTIASTSIPTGSTVDRIQFTISSVSANLNGTVYPVTTLSNQLVVSILNRNGTAASQAPSGALLDLNPTLVQIRATNSTNGVTSYYVLVPSATAILKTNVGQDQSKVGAKVELQKSDKNDLDQAQQEGSKSVTITSTTISVKGDTTTFNITLKNTGGKNATMFGLTLHGDFNATTSCTATATTTTTTTSSSSASGTATSTTSTSSTSTKDHGHEGNHTTSSSTQQQHHGKQGGRVCGNKNREHPDTIPFRINGTSLVPLFGDEGHGGIGTVSSLTIKPGESVTLTFSGVIQLKADSDKGKSPLTIITPVPGNTYAVRLMGEGFQTTEVQATS